MLAALASESPAAVAVLAPGRADATFARTLDHVRRVGRALAALGLPADARVAVAGPDSAELALLMLGSMAHAAALPLGPKLTAEELAGVFDVLRPHAVAFMAGTAAGETAAGVARKLNLPTLPCREDPNGPAGALAFDVPLADTPRPARSASDLLLVVPTGGTTGRPKAVPLSHANVLTMMRANVGVLGLTPADRTVNVMPLCHIHGLGAVLCSLLAGGSVAITTGFSADTFFDHVDAYRPTWYTSVPTIHQAVLAAAERSPERVARMRQRGGLRLVRSGSAPMPPGVPERLEALFDARYVEAFGATESSAYLCSNRPADRKIGSVGRPMPGVVLKVRTSDGRDARPGEEGELVVKSPGLFKGYDDDPAATALAFDGDWFRTGDLGRLDPDGYVFVTGRIKEQINRGGSKLTPGEVEAALLTHDAVVRCAVFAVPDARLGQDVAAVVVLRDGKAAGELDLQRHAAGLLADYKVPRRIVFRDAIPTSAVGKVQRLSLAAALGLTDAAAATAATPRTALEQALVAIWTDVLGRPVTDVNQSFYTLGGDSVQALQVCLAVEKRFGVSLPLAGLSSRPTVRRLAEILEGDGYKPEPGAPVVIRDGLSGGPTLFVLPGIGGNCYNYHGLAARLPAAWRVVGLPLPGADGLEAPLRCLDAIADRFVASIRATQPHGPYTFVGYSFGGRVGFEIATRLAAAGERVNPLVLLDTPAPDWPPPPPAWERLAMRGRKWARRLRGHKPAAACCETASCVGGTPEIRRRLETLKAACSVASAAWTPTPSDLPVHLLRARESMWKGADVSDPVMGWGGLSDDVRVTPVPGHHLTILGDEHVAAVATAVVTILDGSAKRLAA